VPHVTVGLYSDTWETKLIDRRLNAFPQGSVTSCLISRISLMCYHAPEIGGSLLTIADYDLQHGVLQWRAAMACCNGDSHCLRCPTVFRLP